jgi:hypothetical protein
MSWIIEQLAERAVNSASVSRVGVYRRTTPLRSMNTNVGVEETPYSIIEAVLMTRGIAPTPA